MTDVDAATAPVKVKPKLRGVSHFIAFCVALAASLALVFSPRVHETFIGGLVYSASLITMFGLSALYHRPMWSHSARRVLRRLDHSGIFFLIAGSYTAYWTIAPPALRSNALLITMWACAIVGAFCFVVWTDMPRFLRAGTYVVLGLSSIPLVMNFPAIVGWPRTWVVLLGSLVYIVGAGVYARRWPNPEPRVFGYHEVFHLFVIVAAALQFSVVLDAHWALS